MDHPRREIYDQDQDLQSASIFDYSINRPGKFDFFSNRIQEFSPLHGLDYNIENEQDQFNRSNSKIFGQACHKETNENDDQEASGCEAEKQIKNGAKHKKNAVRDNNFYPCIQKGLSKEVKNRRLLERIFIHKKEEDFVWLRQFFKKSKKTATKCEFSRLLQIQEFEGSLANIFLTKQIKRNIQISPVNQKNKIRFMNKMNILVKEFIQTRE